MQHELNAQLREFTISEMPRPDVAVVQANAQFSDDALILVYSSLRDLNFRSSIAKIDKVSFNANANRYEILISPVKQMLFVYSSDFIESKMATLNPNPKDVYYYKIEEKRQNESTGATGMVKITSQPSGAELYLNGIKTADKTPFSGTLPEARFNLRLTKAKHLPIDTAIFVRGNDTTQYNFAFKPSTVWLNVNSTPTGASVYFQNQLKGKTPLNFEFDFSLNPTQSTAMMQLVLDGHKTYLDTLKIFPSRLPVNLNYTLNPIRALVELYSNPEGAEVFIDGVYKGVTPFTDSLPLGSYNAFVQLDGFLKNEFQLKADTLLPFKNVIELQAAVPEETTDEEQSEQAIENAIEPDNSGPAIVPTLNSPPQEMPSAGVIDFPFVAIGNQIWMAKNLNTLTYANGDSIKAVSSASDWKTLKTGAWSIYSNKSENDNLNGKLYNWYAVSDKRGLCPVGWRVPSQDDWNQLIEYVGGNKIGAKFIKAPKVWQENKATSVSVGFDIIPSGFRNYYGSFFNLGYYASIWSLNESNLEDAIYVYLYYGSDSINQKEISKKSGLSVRCIKN
ncbi:MAG: FISUMP domain-containing protein [Bacteroidia bacterium]